MIIESIALGTFDYPETFPDCPNRFKFARIQGQVLTVGEALTDWINEFNSLVDTGNRKSSTYVNNRKIVVNKLIPAFGDYILSDLDRLTIKQWASSLDVSAKTLSNNLSPLKQMLEEALDNALIDQNPMAGWSYKNREAPKKVNDVDPFTASDQAKILSTLTGQGQNLIQFAFWTGLRTSEYVALNWNDIDFDGGFVVIDKAHTQAAGKPESTKTISGNRHVKLLPDALSALLAQRDHTYLNGEEVFQNPRTLERWAGDAPIRKTLWTHALKKAGIRYRRPYQTRHTYASMMLSAGESPMWVAQQMGHKDWTMIAKVYGKYIPKADQNEGAKAVQMFGVENNSK